MKIEYRRNLMISYMVIEQKQEILEWEKEMIAHNHISGMIFADCVRENEKNQLWYDIGGKQALDSVVETTKLNYEILCMLLVGIYEMLGKLEEFLLNPNGMLLCPECIFFDNEGKNIYFCYCSAPEKTLPEMFGELMEYLLTQIDHTDKAAVELAYNLYEQAVKEGFCLRDLQDQLRISYERETNEMVENESQEIEEFNINEAADKRIDKKADRRTDKKIDGKINRKAYRQIDGKIDRKAHRQIDAEIMPHVEKKRGGIGQKLMEFLGKCLPYKKERRSEEIFAFEPDDEPEIKKGRPTVLLSELVHAPEGVLRYEGDGEGYDLKIETLPYLIGSDTGCDGYIPSSTVSRKHARITKTEDIYFIEDLNSSNGTSVGGEMLNYRTKMSLERNEIVMFADEKFRFI